jgi:hypothetical protein
MLSARYADVSLATSWGETALFYNPGKRLPRGIYFATLKDHDGANDKASALHRHGVFRLSLACRGEMMFRALGQCRCARVKGVVLGSGTSPPWTSFRRTQFMPGWAGRQCSTHRTAHWRHYRPCLTLPSTRRGNGASAGASG